MPSHRINAWSSPRNISTAFMYSFAQRTDTTVVDEPLYAHYLSKSNTQTHHPGKDLIISSQENDGEKVVRQIIMGDYPTEIVLFKQMTHHLIQLKEDFLFQTDNILLIRDPRAIIASYAKVIPNPAMEDVGIQQQYELYHKLNTQKKISAVIDATQLLINPKQVLTQLCEQLTITFQKQMLQWQAGPRPEDGVWAKYWYSNVHQSTGFKKYTPKTIELPSHLEGLAETCQPYYDFLFQVAIKATKE